MGRIQCLLNFLIPMAGISQKKFYNVLVEKDIPLLYHANSVATACLFLRRNALLSRGVVQGMNWKQTPQKSDLADKRYSIWFDIFLDSVDLHHRMKAFNLYGPVTFVINTKILSNTMTGQIWATKLNPTKWTGVAEKSRWFQDKYEFEDDFEKGTFDHMIVLRHCGGILPLGDYLEEIILDDPEITVPRDIDVYSMAYGALKCAMVESGINIPIKRRSCPPRCKCTSQYQDDRKQTRSMFHPMVIEI